MRGLEPIFLSAPGHGHLPFTSEASAPFSNEPEKYHNLREICQATLKSKLENPNRFQPISEREDRSDWPAIMRKLQFPARYLTLYRGCDIIKSPEDFETYHQLFWHIRPATVIELGTYTGGFTTWIADTIKLSNIPCHTYSFDLDNSLLCEAARELNPEDVTFLQGDCFAIEKTFTPDFMENLAHPWVVIEDAHENLANTLKHFHQFMKQGDYFVVEDTDPYIPKQLPSNPGIYNYDEENGTIKLEKLKKFLQTYKEHYAVDSFFTDLYGYNGTWHWHGFVKRMI